MLHVAIAAGLVLGLAVGLLASATGSELLLAIANASAPLGTAFLNAIRMVVIPLVMAVIFSGVAKLGDPRTLGRLGVMTLVFFWSTLIPAILIGMGAMRLGLVFAPELAVPPSEGGTAPELPGFVEFLVGLIPANPFAAASAGALLPLIVFTALLAAATGTIEAGLRDRLIGLADALGAALIKLVHWILWTAPVGVFGLAAPVTARMGWTLLASLAVFILSVIAGLAVLMAVLYLPLLRGSAGMGPRRFFRGTFGGAAVAFSTTSTVAALPVMLEEAKGKLGVTPAAATLILPLGASMYRPGSALFQGAAIIFLAHLFQVPIAPAAVGGALLATFLVSLTVAPVPSSGVVTLAPALDAVGIPLAGLAILLGVDRIPDMFRSSVNSLGQSATAILVDRWMGGGAGVAAAAAVVGVPAMGVPPGGSGGAESGL
jgi:proton glutamate symport protein